MYCPKAIDGGPVTCHTFLGGREEKDYVCGTCNSIVCGRCAKLASKDDGDSHMCSDSALASPVDGVKEGEDYVRGEHFQIVRFSNDHYEC